MADTPLNNDPNGQNILSSVVALYGALRGALVPRTADGEARHLAADLGTTTKWWNRIFVRSLVVGGEEVNVANLAAAAPAYVFAESDPAFSWPADLPNCLAVLYSGGSGGSGGAAALNGFPNNLASGGRPEAGGATTLTIGGRTFSTGQPFRGGTVFVSETGQVGVSISPNQAVLSTAGGTGGTGGRAADASHARITTSRQGLTGYCNVISRRIAGLNRGDALNIQLGKGGEGGGISSVWASQAVMDAIPEAARAGPGEDGQNGIAILYALP